MKKTVTILGSTGSIGKNTVNVILNNKDKFQVKYLVAFSNYKLLIEQAIHLNAEYIVLVNDQFYNQAKEYINNRPIKILSGFDALLEISNISVDIAISAISGIQGFMPTVNLIRNSKRVCIANKESIVCGGIYLQEEIKKFNTEIIPIDSEHNAIFQIMNSNKNGIKNITLTASGGPFLNTKIEDLEKVTLKQALNHPNWSMGKKITIDSATMANKCLELIEACFLFNLKEKDVNILIHPESIIHGMVNYIDGSTISHMAMADMQVPIIYSLSYPDRYNYLESNLCLSQIQQLSFFEPDQKKFPIIRLVRDILNKDNKYCILFNVTNDYAVNLFLENKIKYNDIFKIINHAINSYNFNFDKYNLDNISDIIDDINSYLKNSNITDNIKYSKY